MSQKNTWRVRFAEGSNPTSSSSFPRPSTPGAPHLGSTPLPDTSPDMVQARLPLSGHHVEPGSSLLFSTHVNQTAMSISSVLGLPAQLIWDVSVPPENATVGGVRVTPEVLKQEATTPPTPTLTIRISLLLEHTLNITPSIPGGFVTVDDVMKGVYCFLRRPMPTRILTSVDQYTRRGVENAYRNRYWRLSSTPVMYQQEKAKGFKYVDLLLGQTRWDGLSAIGPGEVTLYLSSSSS